MHGNFSLISFCFFQALKFVMNLKSGYPFWLIKYGLPFIASCKDLPNSYFALGFGGNGIIFSRWRMT
jgi:hypothetical protein